MQSLNKHNAGSAYVSPPLTTRPPLTTSPVSPKVPAITSSLQSTSTTSVVSLQTLVWVLATHYCETFSSVSHIHIMVVGIIKAKAHKIVYKTLYDPPAPQWLSDLLYHFTENPLTLDTLALLLAVNIWSMFCLRPLHVLFPLPGSSFPVYTKLVCSLASHLYQSDSGLVR